VTINGVISAIFVGLVIGALARLVVPGRQPIGCLLTLLMGIVGAVTGTAAADAVGVDSWFVVLAFQVGVAAVGVAVIAAALRARTPPGPPPPWM